MTFAWIIVAVTASLLVLFGRNLVCSTLAWVLLLALQFQGSAGHVIDLITGAVLGAWGLILVVAWRTHWRMAKWTVAMRQWDRERNGPPPHG